LIVQKLNISILGPYVTQAKALHTIPVRAAPTKIGTGKVEKNNKIKKVPVPVPVPGMGIDKVQKNQLFNMIEFTQTGHESSKHTVLKSRSRLEIEKFQEVEDLVQK
jgi:hypothetical protein